MKEATLHIYTLGTFAISIDDVVIETFLTRKTALLLVYLAMNPSVHGREVLAPLFWSETTDAQALKNLRTVLSDLRKNTPNAITITRQSVQINDDMWIDVSQFKQGCEAILAGEQCTLDEMLGVLDLYCGDFLPNLPIRHAESLAQWVEQQRNRLQQMHEHLLYHIVEHCLQVDDAYTGITLARQLVMLNPLWEAAQRQLMRLLMQLDQAGEAQMQYRRLVDLMADELETTPEPETVALYEQIKSGLLTPESKIPSQIVLPDVPYIAPEASATLLLDMLKKPDCHLVTVTGISGTGKSTLATFIAHGQQAFYQDGVAIVMLSNVQDSAGLAQAILSNLNATVNSDALDDQVIATLKERDMLIVLDNYEHLLPETALVERIIEEAPTVRLLVTSQVALNLRGEWSLQLTGLEVAQDSESEAFQLFRKTAERIKPRIDLSAYHDEIAQICTLLEGLPLGIVIAAGQVKYLSPSQILGILRDDPLTLTSAYQDMPERHRGFTNLVSATLAHLSDEEKRGLRALAIFRSNFQHEAAIAIAEIDMSTFIGLVDKSLVQPAENFRYGMHGVLRRVFLDQLRISGEYETVRQRLTHYYINWCYDLYQQDLEKAENIRRLDAEHANIWHLDLLTASEQERYLLEIVPTLLSYWHDRGFTQAAKVVLDDAVNNEHYPANLRARGMVELAALHYYAAEQETLQTLCERAMELAPDNLYVQVDARQNLARLMMQRGDNEAAWSYLMAVMELEARRSTSDDPRIDYLLMGNHTGMGLVAMRLDELDIAESHYKIAMNGFERLGEPLLAAQARNNLALLDMRAERYEAARQHFEAVLAVTQIIGHASMTMACMGNLGKCLMMLGDMEGAYRCLYESIQLTLKIESRQSLLFKLQSFAELAYFIEHFTIATQLYGYVFHRSETDNIAFYPYIVEKIEKHTEEMQAELGSRYDQLTTLGHQLSEDAALNLAYSLKDYV